MLQAVQLVDHGEARLVRPEVDGGQRRQQVEAQARVIVQRLADGADRPAVDDHRRLSSELLHGRQPVAELLAQDRHAVFDVAHRLASAARSLNFSPRTLACSVRMPWISASGRGGQPATYTSTGTISSTPGTMA